MKPSYLVTLVVVVLIGAFAVWYSPTHPQPLSPLPVETNIPIVQATDTAPIIQSTSTATQASSSVPQVSNGQIPKITSITPMTGPTGASVTLHGTGFDKSSNLVLFGNSNGRHHPDGSPDNSRGSIGSADGKSLTFQVPNSGPSGILCDSSNHCVGIAAMLLVPGSYKVAVKNANGTSNVVSFAITK